MKRALLSILCVSAMLIAFAQKPYKVVFYNLENLFRTKTTRSISPKASVSGPLTATTRNSTTWSACCSTSHCKTKTSQL